MFSLKRSGEASVGVGWAKPNLGGCWVGGEGGKLSEKG